VLWSGSAYAEFRQQVRYFGTLGAGTYDGKYTYVDLDSGTNVTDSSKFGLNISVADQKEWSFFAELLAQPQTLEAPWYFVNWRASDSVIIRGGKTRFANWLYSETRSIGYTYPWPELPSDVYRVNPLTSMYGISAEYSIDSSVGSYTLDLQIGSVDTEFQGAKIRSNLATAGTITYQFDDFKWIFSGLISNRLQLELAPFLVSELNANYFTSSIKSQIGQLVLISEIGQIKAAPTNRERENSRVVAAKARAEIQANPQMAGNSELQAAIGRSYIAEGSIMAARTGYLHIGYEIGAFQPYLLGSILDAEKNSIFAKSNSRYGGGFLWLASEQVAVKAQATRVVLDNKNYGLTKVPQQDALLGSTNLGIRSATIIQASMDFLF
jgi:hypothetical protein